MPCSPCLHLAGGLAAAALLSLTVPGCGGGNDGGGASGGASGGPSGGSSATTTPAADGSAAVADGAAAAAVTLPSYWFESDFDAWLGQRYTDLDLIRFMATPPEGLDEGTRYVVFYRRSCDHCQEMFEADLALDDDLAARVTAVEVPEDADTMRGENPWPMPDTACTLAELPVGPNWIMTTPLTVRLEDGVVACAEEGDHHECMGLVKD